MLKQNMNAYVDNDLSNKCANILAKKVEISKKFVLNNISFTLQLLSSYNDYFETRELISMVSKCSVVHNEIFVNEMIKSNNFYPIIIKCISDNENKGNNNKSIVGYFEIYLLPHLGRTFDARIERVVVHPDYRNIGLCQIMMSYAIDICKNILLCNRIDLYVENEVAMHIYKKIGFSQINTNVLRLGL